MHIYICVFIYIYIYIYIYICVCVSISICAYMLYGARYMSMSMYNDSPRQSGRRRVRTLAPSSSHQTLSIHCTIYLHLHA